MAQFIYNVQTKIKSGSSSTFTFVIKLISGLILGLIFALIGQEIFNYEAISFNFIIIVTLMVFLRKTRHWNFVGVMVFDLVCVLLALLLRMYILIAPGA